MPAALTGLIMALASARVRHGSTWLILSGATGTGTTLLTLRIIDLDHEGWGVVIVGGATAILCALITRRWRPRSVSRPASP